MATFPLPLNVTAVTEPSVYEAVIDFCKKFATPLMDETTSSTGRYFRAWGSRQSYPNDNDYAVVTIINHTRHGSTVEDYDATGKLSSEDGTLTLAEYITVEVQIDFCSDPHTSNDYARRRAQSIETVARSYWSTQFFKTYGLSCVDVTPTRDMSFRGDANQYVSRWMTTLTLGFWTEVTMELPWFDTITLRRLEDVDEHHKPH